MTPYDTSPNVHTEFVLMPTTLEKSGVLNCPVVIVVIIKNSISRERCFVCP
jgi:hypothetical protein